MSLAFFKVNKYVQVILFFPFFSFFFFFFFVNLMHSEHYPGIVETVLGFLSNHSLAVGSLNLVLYVMEKNWPNEHYAI